MLVVFVLLAALGSIVAALDERILVRDFSLVTDNGENILHKNFNRRRLTEGSRRLSLTFRAADLDVSNCLYLGLTMLILPVNVSVNNISTFLAERNFY